MIDFIDQRIGRVDDWLMTHQSSVQKFHEQIRQWSLQVGQQHILPALRRKIEHVLQDDHWWTAADGNGHQLILSLQQRVPHIAQQPWLHRGIQTLVPRMIDRLQINRLVEQRINAMDLGQLEQFIRRVARDNLAAIEVLGGVIGMAAGLAQHTPLFLIGLIVAAFGMISWIRRH